MICRFSMIGLVVMILMMLAGHLGAAEPAGLVQKFVDYNVPGGDGQPTEVHCVISFPQGYQQEAPERWPLIVFLHGGAPKDVQQTYDDVLFRLARAHPDFPFVVVAPYSKGRWRPVLVKGVVQSVLATCRVDADRVYLTGPSMGGFGAWDTACAYPELFAVVVPVCGGGDTKAAGQLKGLPVWAFHGDLDDTVPPAFSKDMVAAVNAAGGNAKLTMYEGVGHGSWGPAYNTVELWEWMLKHRRQGAAVVEQPLKDSDPAIMALRGMRVPLTMAALLITQHLTEVNGADPAAGVSFSLPVPNALDQELKVKLEWDRRKNPAWKVEGGPESLTLAGGQEGVMKFTASNADGNALFPLPPCKVSYVCGGVEVARDFRVPMDIDAYLARHRPALTIKPVGAPPAIDGKLDDPAWKRPADVTGFVHPDLQEKPLVDTEAWVSYGDKRLYVAMRCHEPFMDGLVAAQTARDGEVWNDDCVEVFIDPTGERKDYYQFIVNTNAAIYDSHKMDSSFNADVRAAASRQADGFVIELSIPWADLGVAGPLKGKTMSFLLARDRQAKAAKGKPAADKQNAEVEILQYPPVNGWNHRVQNYGELKLD